MSIITPDGILPVCDMVDLPYFENIQLIPKSSGVIMCHSILNKKDNCHLRTTMSKLPSNGRYVCICWQGDDQFEEWAVKEFPQVKYWIVTNCNVKHECVEAIPFGISMGGTNRTTNHCSNIEKVLTSPKTILRDVFACFSINSTNGRDHVRAAIDGKDFATWSDRLPGQEFLEGIYHHTFTLSPKGQGEDCVRTWESLYLKSYPIVKRCATYECFNDMPIAIVDDWSEITNPWLEAQKIEMAKRSVERLRLEYWLARIADIKRRFL